MEAWILSIMRGLGYAGVLLLMFLENVFPPLPSELIMPLAGFAAQRGEFTFVGVVAAGIAGSLIGQFPLYLLGRAVSAERLHRFADRYGKWITISGQDVDRAGRWLQRRGAGAVFFCRLVPGARSLISIPAGASRMALPSFTLYSTLGISLWSATLAWLGYWLGRHYELVQKYLGPVSTWIWAALAVAFVGWLAWRLRGCILHNRGDCPFAQAAEPAELKQSEEHSRDR